MLVSAAMNPPAALALSIRVTRDGVGLLGPGRADLLQAIDQTGSIAAAGRQMAMSYKRAWELVEAMNAAFPSPLVAAAKGGAGGGGAKLTESGQAVLAAYQALQSAAAEAAAAALEMLNTALDAPDSPENVRTASS